MDWSSDLRPLSDMGGLSPHESQRRSDHEGYKYFKPKCTKKGRGDGLAPHDFSIGHFFDGLGIYHVADIPGGVSQ
jgi:hypothetical protein